MQAATYAVNAAGELVPTWATVQTLRALVESQGGSELTVAGQTVAITQYTVSHRYYAPLTSLMRYLYGTLILEISAVNDDPRKTWHVATCLQSETTATSPPPPPPPPVATSGFFGAGFWKG